MISISAKNISKNFNRRKVLRDISFLLNGPASLAITGKNGSGKSTLSKIIAGVLSYTSGSLDCTYNGKKLSSIEFRHHIGFVSPYLNFYDEFTALENLLILSRIRSMKCDETRIKEFLTRVNLWHRRDDITGTYSSGMKQRLKYAFAILHQPEILILDEPSSNLDSEGMEFVHHIVEEQKRNSILIIATNNNDEAKWCEQNIRVGELN